MDSNTVDSAAALAVACAQPATFPGGKPYVVVPAGFVVQDMEASLPAPTRPRGTATLTDAQSFIAYVSEMKSPSTRLYGQANPPKFTAVFNDHGDDAGWQHAGRRHQARGWPQPIREMASTCHRPLGGKPAL